MKALAWVREFLRILEPLFYVLLVVVTALFIIVKQAKADDAFWYYYPMPQAYLYVDDPVLYRMWEAQYIERSVTVPGEDVRFPFTETIYFGYGSCEVGREFFTTIQGISELIANNEAIAVLGGHTDVRGEADVNVKYGFCRIQSVVDLLEAFGIPSVQLNQVSYGADELAIEGAETEAGHSLNRRVTIDFTIISPGESTTSMETARAVGKWEPRDYLGLWRD